MVKMPNVLMFHRGRPVHVGRELPLLASQTGDYMGNERNYVAEREGKREHCANNAPPSGAHQVDSSLRFSSIILYHSS